jgi:hypothetical protein
LTRLLGNKHTSGRVVCSCPLADATRSSRNWTRDILNVWDGFCDGSTRKDGGGLRLTGWRRSSKVLLNFHPSRVVISRDWIDEVSTQILQITNKNKRSKGNENKKGAAMKEI